MKKRFMPSMLCFFASLCVLAAGCGASGAQESAAADTASPTSDWIFGEVSDSGDIEINSEVLSKLETRVYEFDEAPTILIYHTHATEAFLQDGDYTYAESEKWRTEDNEKNIVHAGEVLKSELEALGFSVIHDTTNVEPPELLSAYSRSLEVMKKYEDIDIYIDLHRNAADVGAPNNTALADGKECARMFFVVGTGVGTYEGEYDVAPEWKANYTFALSVKAKIENYSSSLMKPIRTKVGRFNQHMGMCLLLELGNNANTMEEALSALPYFAKAFGEAVRF